MFTNDEIYNILISNDKTRINDLRLYKGQIVLKEILTTFIRVIKEIENTKILGYFHNIEFIMDMGFKNMKMILNSVSIDNEYYSDLIHTLSAYPNFNKYRHVVVQKLYVPKNIPNDYEYNKYLHIFHFTKQDFLKYIKQNNSTMVVYLHNICCSYHTNDIEYDCNYHLHYDTCNALLLNNCTLPYSICYDAIKYNEYKVLNLVLENGYKVTTNEGMILTKKIKKVLKKHNIAFQE